ncbi:MULTISPECIES: bifunctional [glutamine synthetase] adenylyltransferase/[glutamine synthetase]-adenylyl-L-tyrosine phosphorylase [unclassified Sphingopyxis]|uniref:bifunctional [glutamine synthetase] adenylyltransferase/[glutamine synthetase]-adenylyl-L-tyrosine phosphorylase n=1 Tax=unclassified Sphingopyxis TaxID=2614943 RepID=UPI000730C1AA|nr:MULTISPECIES: bifunctional [glutamine synthetase] adenylyltransferase/[glutamine synthetase]-adenylyl-L-tyrosine phosphorylase [unclassified Sphingopyxis]KTE28172.1 glutamine-synthetase adenylyltransferase [Sphingopyxis sp. H057]KTE55448.1 glutamine-synthetase adenylyltransferase [Sphingopyxis sp. H073]KTE57665.1 glutamine-synthetase adenylyltransferase [Sphingopyxis sp. H071]KTE61102.1 glutamine-synthetase adenylyltransferase [Sphingopyxis sp. H107]KTE66335.1 glutamine-synthetase adenylylt
MIASDASARRSALDRLTANAPFLARLAELNPDDVARFLGEGADAALAEVAPPPVDDDIMRTLRQWRGRMALLLALGDLSGEHDVGLTTRLLSDFADTACDIALAAAFAERVPGEEPRGIAVIALGKLGSHELNYSSDIDPILIFDPETMPRRSRDDPGEAAVRIARRMVEILSARTADGHVLRVDLRLRPHPEVTPIVLPESAAISYYESEALAWEQAAFIRSRASAGDRALGNRFLAAIQPFIWRRSLDFRQLKEIGAMSDRIRDHFSQGQAFGPGYDLKRGRGGIREIEFFAQVHQLIYGGRDPSLRLPATVDALAALAKAGRVDADVAERLTGHYALLRRIEHRLQMIEDQQTQCLPVQPAALDGVARLDGEADGAALLATLQPVVTDVGACYDRLVAERAATSGLPRDEGELAGAVMAAGFDPPDAALRTISEWRGGKLRALRSAAALEALETALPELVKALGAAPDPDAALLRFDKLVGGLPSAIGFFHLLAAQPALAKIATRILWLAPALADALGARVELIEGLIDKRAFEAPATKAELLAEWAPGLAGLDYERLLDRVRDRVGERRFAYGVQIIAGSTDPLAIACGYSELAEAALQVLADATVTEFVAAHGRVPDSELVVLALGRLGGRALTHASDLDLIYLFTGDHLAESDGPRPLGATTYYNRLAQRVSGAMSVPTAAGKLYDVDTRLRPQGAQGPLVVTLDSFERYQREEAWTWEHMALLRARPVYGSDRAKAAVQRTIDELLAAPRDRATVAQDAAEMRDKIAAHKPPKGPLDIKGGPGGLVDLEFAMQVTQLATGRCHDPNIGSALACLRVDGLAPPEICDAHGLLARMLVMLRLTAPEGEPATAAARQLVASACGEPGWPQLLAAHDAARQEIADWWASIRPPQQETKP